MQPKFTDPILPGWGVTDDQNGKPYARRELMHGLCAVWHDENAGMWYGRAYIYAANGHPNRDYTSALYDDCPTAAAQAEALYRAGLLVDVGPGPLNIHGTEVAGTEPDAEPYQITEVSVSYGETMNLGDYSNVKPEVRLRATLRPGMGPDVEDTTMAELWAIARNSVQAEIDATLEQRDRPAVYSPDPRYSVIEYTPSAYGPVPQVGPAIFAVVPDGTEIEGMHSLYYGHRAYKAKQYLYARVRDMERKAKHQEIMLETFICIEPLQQERLAALETRMASIRATNERNIAEYMQKRDLDRNRFESAPEPDDDEGDEGDEESPY